jgi:hypothetical protein
MKKRYNITYYIYQTIEFDDNEMREYGYEGEITEEQRKEYLNILLQDEYNVGINYNEIYIEEDIVDDKNV